MTEWWDVVDCTGRTVLDLGGYDGGWGAKPALERGAKEATVVDSGEWTLYQWQPPVSEHPQIQFVEGDLLEWSLSADIVIASNVVYHLKDPPGCFPHLRKLTREAIVIRTSTATPEEANADGWCWYPNGSGHPNGTVWARPTEEGLARSMMKAGFINLQKVDAYGGLVVVGRVP